MIEFATCPLPPYAGMYDRSHLDSKVIAASQASLKDLCFRFSMRTPCLVTCQSNPNFQGGLGV